jgi:nicotinate-nucleotide pyrophosphorylase (carboxylating)
MKNDLDMVIPSEEWVKTLVAQALKEDVGSGDVSTIISVDPSVNGRAQVVSRQEGVVAGLPLLEMVYGQVDPAVNVETFLADGTPVRRGTVVARLEGPVGSILTGERTALNFLQHLGGIASLTAQYVKEAAGTGCRVLDTRKTLPGYRSLAKYAVLCGGGHNHRLGLYDRIMLKDNHWSAAGRSIELMVARARQDFPDLAIEIEVDTLDQLEQVLPLKVAWILLDNFTVLETAEAVARRDGSGVNTLLESSGNITLETIAHYARTGVDGASVGRLTHSAGALDLGLDLESS